MEDFSARLRQAMAMRGMKASELAEKTKVGKSAISQYLSGKFNAKQDRVYIMSKALNVDPAWLMGYEVPMEPKKPDAVIQGKPSVEVINVEMLNEEGQDRLREYMRLLANDKRYRK